jgi:hypothetical protein
LNAGGPDFAMRVFDRYFHGDLAHRQTVDGVTLA